MENVPGLASRLGARKDGGRRAAWSGLSALCGP
jgi:hypothetical protein